MILIKRVNCVNRGYPPFRNCDLVGVLNGGDEPELVKWLGIIDRRAVRRIDGAQEVALDFIAFQADLLTPTYWFPKDQSMVGCRIEEGALAVMDGARPLLKRRRSQSVGP
jgi:hypothetical protein